MQEDITRKPFKGIFAELAIYSLVTGIAVIVAVAGAAMAAS
jgi:hypothetical protein